MSFMNKIDEGVMVNDCEHAFKPSSNDENFLILVKEHNKLVDFTNEIAAKLLGQ